MKMSGKPYAKTLIVDYLQVVGFGDKYLFLYVHLHFSTMNSYYQELTGCRRCSMDLGCAQSQAPHWPWPKWWRPLGPAPGAPYSQCPGPGRTQHPHQPGFSLRWSWWWWLSAGGSKSHLGDPYIPPLDTPRMEERGQRRMRKSIRDMTYDLYAKVFVATNLTF